MPGKSTAPSFAHTWPVKVLRGNFSSTKRLNLSCRYARRRIRVVFES